VNRPQQKTQSVIAPEAIALLSNFRSHSLTEIALALCFGAQLYPIK
jgi:hypothetical protein